MLIERQLRGKRCRSALAGGMLRTLCFLLPMVFALINAGCMSGGVDSLRLEPYRPVTGRSGDWVALAHPSLGIDRAPVSTEAPRGDETVAVAVPKLPRERAVELAVQPEANTEVSVTDDGDGHQRVRALEHGDRVTIQIEGPESTRIEDVVDDAGRITLPLIGHVVLAGRTTAEVEKEIERAFIDGKIYKYVNVSVVSLDDEFFVRGEVNKEGRFSLTGNMTLGKSLIVAGGYTEYAKKTGIMIRRGDKVLTFDMKKIDKGEAPDPLIRRGDVIVVKRRWFW